MATGFNTGWPFSYLPHEVGCFHNASVPYNIKNTLNNTNLLISFFQQKTPGGYGMKDSENKRRSLINVNDFADTVVHRLFVERFRAEEENLNYNNLLYGQVSLKKSKTKKEP
jgi:hypothetical protein